MATIATRIRDNVPAFKQVGTAAAFAKALEGLRAAPAAFVMPAREVAQENPFMGQAVEQMVGSDFAVIIAARDLTDATGGASKDALEPIRESLRDALLNWRPDSESDGCSFVSGEMFQLDPNGVCWWVDTYRSGYQIRSL
jgi:hypothetical protein